MSEVGRAECGRVARLLRVLTVLAQVLVGRVVGVGGVGAEVVAGRRCEGCVTASDSRHGGQVKRAAAYEAGGGSGRVFLGAWRARKGAEVVARPARGRRKKE